MYLPDGFPLEKDLSVEFLKGKSSKWDRGTEQPSNEANPCFVKEGVFRFKEYKSLVCCCRREEPWKVKPGFFF